MHSESVILGAVNLAEAMSQNAGWLLVGGIVLVGLLGLGWRDLTRFSARRTWAISSVCFAESIRRRVLWLTPLAIVGVILIVQFQKPLDEQDAIRQTIKFSLFATGLLVVLATIILACTNLPKEIENRVIYTIVTKPTTRLEIVLGKIVGFARVSAAILLIMGLFTWGYLHLRAWAFQRDIAAKLQMPETAGNPLSRSTLEHYANHGLLTAKTLGYSSGFDMYARDPDPGNPDQAGGPIRWISGNDEQEVLIPFELRPEDLPLPDAEGNLPAGLAVKMVVNVGLERLESATAEESLPQQPAEEEPPVTPLGPFLKGFEPVPTTAPATPSVTRTAARARTPLPPVNVRVKLLTADGQSITDDPQMSGGILTSITRRGVLRPAEVPLLASVVAELSTHPGRFYALVSGVNANVNYAIGGDPIQFTVVGLPGGAPRHIARAQDNQGRLVPPAFCGRSGGHGQQLKGSSKPLPPVAVFRFRDLPAAAGPDGKAGFEWRTGIERTSDQASESTDDITHLSFQVRNLTSGRTSEPILVDVESNRTAYFGVPAEFVSGGQYDVAAHCLNDGHWPGIRTGSLALIAANESFDQNLLKSLLIMWLLTIMVTMVSVLCSTFLSWPIAIVLAVLMLLGNWGVQQLGDALTPGVGNSVATDFGFTNAAKAKVVSESVEALNRFLKLSTTILPDISRFSATDEIERGIAIPYLRLWEALQVLGRFGIPITVLGYLFLKNKEVAP